MGVTYVRHAPRPPLDEYLQGVWYFEGGQTAHTRERVLPHGAMQLVIDLDDDRLEVFDPRDLAHPRRFGGPLLCGPTPTTRFRIGSVSKQFTAMAILMLEKRNRLNVSDPVCAHLAACPQAWGQVIPTTKATLLIVFRQPVTPAAQVAQAGERPLVTQPGTEWRYCNVCYAALGLVVEKESGTTVSEDTDLRSVGYARYRHRPGPVHTLRGIGLHATRHYPDPQTAGTSGGLTVPARSTRLPATFIAGTMRFTATACLASHR